MRLKFLTYAIATLAVCCLGSCHESFPEENIGPVPPVKDPTMVYTDEEENISEVIKPTLSDPHFSFVVPRQDGPQRAKGAFNGWNADSEKWMSADFHIFAYQTTNTVDGRTNGYCDMTQTSDGQTSAGGNTAASRVLLYDRIMRIVSASGDVMLYLDEDDARTHGTADQHEYSFRFPNDNIEARYKFYTYYADDADDHFPIRTTTTTVTRDVEIDGTQDLMHAFAYHSYDAFANHIETFLKANVDSSDLFTLFNPANPQATYNNYLYSTKAAHHRLQPIFHVNHLMTRLNINVAGGSKDGTSVSEDYKNITITGVEFLDIHNRGTITIADNRWEMNSYIADSANLVRWDDSYKADLKATIKPNTSTGDNYFRVNSMAKTELTEPILLPPGKSYKIRLRWLYDWHDADGNTSTSDGTTTYEVQLPFIGETTPTSFVQGAAYTITIFVYGPQDIRMSLDLDKPWYDGGTVSVDEEDSNVYK